MTLSIIVAISRNNAIGKGGELLYHIREDLRRFKMLTIGHAVIMGRRTFESLPTGPLPDRKNIVMTRSEDFACAGVAIAHSFDEALSLAGDDEEVFIIGGGDLYRQTIGNADRLYLTIVDQEVPDADTFFPELDNKFWEPIEVSDQLTDLKSGLNYRFMTLQRV